jgi:hypothetical protein
MEIWMPTSRLTDGMVEGTSNKYPSSSGLRRAWNQKMSNYFVEDGGFFRIQNINLSYKLNNKNVGGGKIT